MPCIYCFNEDFEPSVCGCCGRVICKGCIISGICRDCFVSQNKEGLIFSYFHDKYKGDKVEIC